MILLIAIAAGLLAGLTRARWGNRAYRPLDLSGSWLVLVGVLPQLAAFSFPATAARIPGGWAPFILSASLLPLLLFAFLNLRKPGFWLLALGLLANFLVIVVNGGLMPISPETVEWMIPTVPQELWSVGQRLGTGKDIVLPVDQTHFWFLSDQLRSPAWLWDRLAFSVGDVLIAAGVFWLLWAIGGPTRIIESEKKNK